MKVVDRITTVLGYIGGLGIVVLMLLTVVDVTLRKLSGKGLGGTIEYSEIVLVGCVFLGMAAAQRAGEHVSTSVLTSHLPRGFSRNLRVAAGVVGAVVVALMLYATADAALVSVQSGEFRFGLVRVPVWPARILVPIGLALFLLQFIRSLVTVARDTHRPAPDLADDERPETATAPEGVVR